MKKKKQQTSIEVIIVNYNASFWLKKTLSSFYETYANATTNHITVTVVDNASTDDSVQMLKDTFPQVHLLQEAENKGYAYANNRGIEESNADFILLLNSDMELTKESQFDILIDFAAAHPQVGIITPKVVFLNGNLDPACHRGEPTLWASFCYFTKLEMLFPRTKTFGQYHLGYKKDHTIHTIDACSGAAMLIRRSYLNQVGLFDERFFMYAEDLDLCKRFREFGYQIVYHPGVTIIHHKYKSGIKGASKKIARETRQHFYDTMLQYFDKHYRDRYPAFVRSLVAGVVALKKGV